MAFKDMTPEEKQSILEHLEELRKSLIISVIAVIIAAVISFSYNEQILALVTLPLNNLNEDLVVIGVTEAFFVKLKLALLSGLIIASPVVLWSFWRFLKPALYPSERKYVYILLPLSIMLFAGGVLFAYFGILQLILKFFIFMVGESLGTMFTVEKYVSFVLAFIIPFGIVFELPVVVYFLTAIGVIEYKLLAKNRKYALLIIVVLAAALTPGPDPFSQLFMAVPVYLLYEISIWISKGAGKKRKKRLEKQGYDYSDDDEIKD